MAIARIIGIWIGGLIASGILGAGVAIQLSRAPDAPFMGFVAGVGAFTCLRLWFGEWARTARSS